MNKLDCPECRELLDSFGDIPETLKRTRRVWSRQECNGAHTLDAWVADPCGGPTITYTVGGMPGETFTVVRAHDNGAVDLFSDQNTLLLNWGKTYGGKSGSEQGTTSDRDRSGLSGGSCRAPR